MHPDNKIFIASTRQVLDTIEPVYGKLMQGGKIPTNAIATQLSEEYYEGICRLHTAVFPNSQSEVLDRLINKSDGINYCLKTSTVTQHNNHVIGVTLILRRKYDDLAYVYAIIVDPKYRNTWGTVFTKYQSAKHLLSSGINNLAFQIHDDNTDTTKLVHKVHAKLANDMLWTG